MKTQNVGAPHLVSHSRASLESPPERSPAPRDFKQVEQVDFLCVDIRSDADAVFARQRARQIAAVCGLDHQSMTRFTTAVSELARNIHQYAGSGRVYFSIELREDQSALIVEFSDQGPGIRDLDTIFDGTYVSGTGMGVGLLGAKRLVDKFNIRSDHRGTEIQIGKYLPKERRFAREQIGEMVGHLANLGPNSHMDEMRNQNHELMVALQELERKQAELRELNQELAETNSGVLALYAELDEKAQSLQKANEVKTNFLSHMTHEFRTPLTSIIGITNLLIERFDGDLSMEQEKQVQFIADASRGLLELVNDLLDLAKVESGRIAIKSSEFTVATLLGALRGMFKPLLLKNPDLQLVISDHEPTLMMCTDEGKVSQILRNLISNAIKFTDSGTIDVSVEDLGVDIRFRVRDTGIGISKENLTRIFEEFNQVEQRTTKPISGTGLGLPLSRKLARILGGTIEVESIEGTGSTFTLRVPKNFTGSQEGVLIGTEPVETRERR